MPTDDRYVSMHSEKDDPSFSVPRLKSDARRDGAFAVRSCTNSAESGSVCAVEKIMHIMIALAIKKCNLAYDLVYSNINLLNILKIHRTLLEGKT